MSESVDSATRRDLSDDLSFLLARANALSLGHGNAALAEHGLKVRSYSVLAMACGDAPPSQREIADHLRLDPSQVVALVDGLQARGLLERRTDAADRRANVVVATAAGHALYDRAGADVAASEGAFLRVLSDTDRAHLARLLSVLAFSE